MSSTTSPEHRLPGCKCLITVNPRDRTQFRRQRAADCTVDHSKERK